MAKEAPSWADQWGAGGSYGTEENTHQNHGKNESGNKKMAVIKTKASAGLDKAKAAAVVGAMKVKGGTSTGFKWMKEQYQKKKSSSSTSSTNTTTKYDD
ncbi:hypothetical protein ACHQM5_001471 [Ranunculus cassubicifolius]